MTLRSLLRAAQFLAVSVLLCGGAHSAVVQSESTFLGGSSWRYDYTITHTGDTPDFDEVTIYFDPSSYSALSAGVAPAGWDPLVIQPDNGIPADGFFDVLNLGGLLSVGDSFSGFSITFNYLLNDAPGVQSFDLYDSSDFSLVGSGRTSVAGANAVPEPESLVLALTALAGIGAVRRKSVKVAA